MAGDPSIIEQIISAVSDNPYTRAWNTAVSGPIAFVERRLYGDEVKLRELAAEAAAARIAAEVLQPGAYRGTALARSFEKLTGIDADLGTEAAFALQGGYQDGLARNLSDAFLEASPKDARRVIAWARENRAARTPLTQAGSAATLLTANPAAAYGLPLAGAGLGAWGLHDLLAARQQEDEEDPLSPKV